MPSSFQSGKLSWFPSCQSESDLLPAQGNLSGTLLSTICRAHDTLRMPWYGRGCLALGIVRNSEYWHLFRYRNSCHPHSGQRQPGEGHRGVVDAASGKTEPKAGGLVQGFSLPGRELEDGAAGGSQGRVPLWRAVPSRAVHRDQPGDGQPGGGAVLQQPGDGGTVDQRRQAGGEDDAAELPPVPVKRGAALAERDRLQPGESVAGGALWARCCQTGSATGR